MRSAEPNKDENPNGIADFGERAKLVSVIIPTFNRRAVLQDCVDSVLESTYKPIEIVIADNASTDDTAEMVKNRYKNRCEVRYLMLSQNLNAAGGRNAGARVARGNYLLFLDSDNVVSADMVGRLVRVLDTHPEAGLVAPLSIQAYNGTIWTLGADYNFLTSMPVSLHAGKRLEAVVVKPLYPTRYSPNAMMVSRCTWERVVGFDPFYQVMYEEADFGFRVTADGVKGFICSDARTLHMGALGNGQVPALRRLGIETTNRCYCFARNRFLFMKRFAPWYGKIAFFVVFAHFFTIYYLAVALRNQRCDIAFAYFRGVLKGLVLSLRPLAQTSLQPGRDC